MPKSTVPKGITLAEGYKDRAQLRREREQAEKAQKDEELRSLQELLQDGTITQELFEEQRAAIIRGPSRDNVTLSKQEQDLDEEFEDLEMMAVEKEVHEKVEKKGEEPIHRPIDKPKSRNEILAALKASRQAKQAPAPQSKWKKVGEESASKDIQVIKGDKQGDEKIVVNLADGKKKIMKKKKAPVIFGADAVVPEQPAQPPPSDDIFEEAGLYDNPFARESDEEGNQEPIKPIAPTAEKAAVERASGLFKNNPQSVLQAPDFEHLKAIAARAKAKKSEDAPVEEGQDSLKRKLAEWQEKAGRDSYDIEYGYEREDSDEEEGARKRKRKK